jgi:hypothetical protein
MSKNKKEKMSRERMPCRYTGRVQVEMLFEQSQGTGVGSNIGKPGKG